MLVVNEMLLMVQADLKHNQVAAVSPHDTSDQVCSVVMDDADDDDAALVYLAH